MLDLGKMKKLREGLKLTQEQAAQKAGMSGRQRWYEIEGGSNVNISLDTLARVASALGVEPADLLVKTMKK